jgi:predicted DsbA family dithiol-disulfide isomerase
MKPIRIFYFSDVFCIWAYIAQIRLEELKVSFSEDIAIDYHFISVFGKVGLDAASIALPHEEQNLELSKR